MSWWMIVLVGAGVWWAWPKLFATTTAAGSAAVQSLSQTVDQVLPAKTAATAATAFRSMETLRDRMIEVGASSEELEQLTTLAPILLRVPPAKEA